MAEDFNQQVVMATRPDGYPQQSDFDLRHSPIPEPEEGELLVKINWLSLDPYQRGRMRMSKSYAAPLEINEVITGGVVGKVIKSRTPRFITGDMVEGLLGWQSYAISNGEGLRKIDIAIGPASYFLGILGMPGLTAYFGLLYVGQPKPGDTVVVSAASGAVGQLVGQIAKKMGCRVIGTAGTNEKVDYIINELGFDAGINYKESDISDELVKYCPDGIDVYFDNVGGIITDAVMNHINKFARIVVCGQISQYNLKEPEMGPRNARLLTVQQARMEGFLIYQFEKRYEEGLQRLSKWLKDGTIQYRENIVHGLHNAPNAFIGMMHGQNFGKLLVKVSD